VNAAGEAMAALGGGGIRWDASERFRTVLRGSSRWGSRGGGGKATGLYALAQSGGEGKLQGGEMRDIYPQSGPKGAKAG